MVSAGADASRRRSTTALTLRHSVLRRLHAVLVRELAHRAVRTTVAARGALAGGVRGGKVPLLVGEDVDEDGSSVDVHGDAREVRVRGGRNRMP